MKNVIFFFFSPYYKESNQVPLGTNFSISSYISSGFCDCPLRSLKITSLEMFVCIPGGSFPYNNTKKNKTEEKNNERQESQFNGVNYFKLKVHNRSKQRERERERKKKRKRERNTEKERKERVVDLLPNKTSFFGMLKIETVSFCKTTINCRFNPRNVINNSSQKQIMMNDKTEMRKNFNFNFNFTFNEQNE
jgi:hypothetical protein